MIVSALKNTVRHIKSFCDHFVHKNLEICRLLSDLLTLCESTEGTAIIYSPSNNMHFRLYLCQTFTDFYKVDTAGKGFPRRSD